MVPAALMGLDTHALLSSARAMADACHDDDPRHNPGLALGAVIAAAALAGRDKLTLSLPARLASFGLWVEQLVAESTGKQGKGIVPISGEARDVAGGDDRVIVRLALGGEPRRAGDTPLERAAPVPTISIDMPDLAALGAEFFRWETATATAGLLLDINPFDEPNVQQAKDATRVLLTTYSRQGRLPAPDPDATFEGAPADADRRRPAGRHRGRSPFSSCCTNQTISACWRTCHQTLKRLHTPCMSSVTTSRPGPGCATMLGYGPRYLHSTGQLHKGGPNTGVFMIVTADVALDLPVPDEPYSFGVLELAQAIGDFESLNRTGRRALHLHLPEREPDALRRAGERLMRAD